jgi:hypothetical protein
MADSMKCLVGLAGTNLANRRLGNAQTVSSASIAEPGGPDGNRAALG